MINVYALLNPVSAIQTLVGTGSSPQQSRIYPGIAPESAALPLIECHVISDTPISTIAGTNDPHSNNYQFSCHAATYDGAQALANAVHDALEGNGYQTYRADGYEAQTKTYSVFLDWSFIDI